MATRYIFPRFLLNLIFFAIIFLTLSKTEAADAASIIAGSNPFMHIPSVERNSRGLLAKVKYDSSVVTHAEAYTSQEAFWHYDGFYNLKYDTLGRIRQITAYESDTADSYIGRISFEFDPQSITLGSRITGRFIPKAEYPSAPAIDSQYNVISVYPNYNDYIRSQVLSVIMPGISDDILYDTNTALAQVFTTTQPVKTFYVHDNNAEGYWLVVFSSTKASFVVRLDEHFKEFSYAEESAEPYLRYFTGANMLVHHQGTSYYYPDILK